MDDIQFSEFLDESIPLWRNDPVMFFREVLNFEPDEWQAEAARDLAANPKVSVRRVCPQVNRSILPFPFGGGGGRAALFRLSS